MDLGFQTSSILELEECIFRGSRELGKVVLGFNLDIQDGTDLVLAGKSHSLSPVATIGTSYWHGTSHPVKEVKGHSESRLAQCLPCAATPTPGEVPGGDAERRRAPGQPAQMQGARKRKLRRNWRAVHRGQVGAVWEEGSPGPPPRQGGSSSWAARACRVGVGSCSQADTAALLGLNPPLYQEPES